jgi:hypothetical protein
MQSDYEYDDDVNLGGLDSRLPPKSYVDSLFNPDDEGEPYKPAVDTQYMLRPPLRSKPTMYFSGHPLVVGSEFSFSTSTANFQPHAPSHMLGSTLHSSLDSSKTHPFPHKTYPPAGPPNLPADVIAALSDTQLYLNPIHRQLQHKYAELCEMLTQYVGRDLRVAESHVAQSCVIPDIYQGA